MRSRHRLAAACLAVLVTACTGGDPADSDTPRATNQASDPTPTDTDTPPGMPTNDPTEVDFTLPDEVTLAYTDLVLNTLYEEWTQVLLAVLSEPPDPAAVVPQDLKDRTAEIFAGQYLLQRLDELDTLARGGNRESFLPLRDFTGLEISTRQIKQADASCLWVAADLSSEGTAVEPSVELAAFSLQPASDANPTGWQLMDVARARGPDGEPVPESVILDSQIEDLEDAVGHTCERGGR